MVKNETNKPMIIDEFEELLQPGYVREYEFLHGYRDITIEEYNKSVEDFKNDPFCQILSEEIQKEINREVIDIICKKAIS